MLRVLAPRALLTVTAILALPSAALAAPPANDGFATAETITGAPATATGTTVEATLEPGEPNHADDSLGRSVWYRWQAPEDGTAVVDTNGSGFATTLAAYTGTAVDGLTRLAAMDAQTGERSRITFTVRKDEVVHVAVDVDYGTAGGVKLNVALEDSPPGDSFAAPEALTGSSATATSDTTFATREAGEPGLGSGGGSVWYTWTAPSDGAVAVDTAGSAFNTVLGVYTGDTFTSLSRIAYNDDVGSGVYTSRAGFEAVAGTTYRIQVDGYYYQSSRGPLKLSLRHAAAAPENDLFASATLLPPDRSVAATGDTLGGTSEIGEPQHYPYLAGVNSVWYSWTAPASGSLTIKATPSGNGFIPILAAYTGEGLVNLARVANQAQDWRGGPQQIRIRVEAGTTYRIALETYGVGGTFGLSLDLIDSPANDDFAKALPLAGLEADASGSTVGATQEPCEPVHDDNYYDPSVWYTWTAPASGAVTIDTAGSDFPTVLGIYTGDELCKLTRAPVGRLTGAGAPAKRTFRAVAGVTYRIAVDGQNGRTGSYKLALRHSPPPANDLLANAEVLSGTSIKVSGSLLGATGEANEPNPGGEQGATVWYSWTAPSTGPTSVRLPSYTFSGGVSVHTGDAMASLTTVRRVSTYDAATFRAVTGTTYRFAVDGGSTPNHGDFTLEVKHTPAPANDDFAAAAPIAGSSATVTGSTAAATLETGEPGPTDYTYHYTGSGSVWYSWTAPADGAVALDTAGSDYDTSLGVFTGTSLSALSRVASNDNVSYSVYTSRVAFRVTAGTTYRILVRSRYQGGALTLRLTHRTPPANDAFAAAAPLPSAAAVSTTGATLGASAETGEPNHYSYDSSKSSVWYTWTAPSSGALTIKATGDFQPVLAAYTGTTITGLTRVRNQAQDWNGGPEQIRVRVEAGTTYYLAVDAFASLAGEFSLSLQLVPSPANDDFAKAQEIAGLAVDVVGNTLGATQELCEPVHDDNYYDPSVWYTWTAPESGAVTLDTTGSDFPTVLGVYTGDELCKLTRVLLRRMNNPPVPARRGFRAVAGRTYRIAVDGWSAKMGNFKLSLRHSPPPANDMFDKPQALTGNLAETGGTNFGATAEPGEPGGIDGATVWYEWTATATGAARVNLPTRDFAANVNVYTGDSLGTLVRANRGYYYDSYYGGVHFRAVAGTKYRIAVAGDGAAAQGDFTLRLVSLAAPANDDFANAIEVSGASGSTAGNLAGATSEPNEPPPSDYYYYGSGERGSVWYSWTAPRSELVKFDTTAGNASVYTGDAVGELKRLPGGNAFRAEAGRTYRISISNSATVDHSPFTLSWKTYPPPPNDAFADAVVLSGASVSRQGTTVGATREAGEPASTWSYGGGGATVWYSWTAPSDGLAAIRSTDGAVGVYTGEAVDSLKQVATSGSSYYGGSVHVRVRAGTTYRIRVEGADLSTHSSFTLNLSTAPSPANDDFQNAATFNGQTVSGTTTGATSEDGEPVRDSYSRGTVWYSWTPTTTGTAVVSLVNSYYHGMAAYTGDSLASLDRRASSGYSPMRFHVKAGKTYRIAVDSEMTTYGRAFSLKAEVQPGQPNDDFADADTLTGTDDSKTGSNVNATIEPGEPTAYYGGRSSVWYRWTAPTSGRVVVDLSGSSYDTTLAAFTGTAPKSLTQVGADNDNGDGSTSKLSVKVRAGTTYHFAVDGYYGATGQIKLALAHTPAPPNDDFSAAAEIETAPATISASTATATREPGEPRNSGSYSYYYYDDGGSSLWYSWTAKVTGRATIDTTGSGFATSVGVYEGSAIGALSRITGGYSGGSDTKVSFDAIRGRTYRISIDGYYGASGTFKLALTQAQPPANDDFDRAEPLSGKAAVVAGTNLGATREDGESTGNWYSLNGSVWYRWTAPVSGTAVFSAQGSGFTPAVLAYSGSALAGAQPVASGSNGVRFYATAGSTYSIAVAGTYAGAGQFTLKLELLEPPSNDLFASSQQLLGVAADVSGSTVNATQEKCEPIHDDNYYDPSVWFSWKAPADGRVVLDTGGSSFATVLGIYTGDYLCTLSRVAVERLSVIGEPAKRAFQAQAGVTYRIAVDGQRGVTGDYKLSLRQTGDVPPKTEPPPPDATETRTENGEQSDEPQIVVPPESMQDGSAGDNPPPGDPVVESGTPPAQDPPAQDPPAQDPPTQGNEDRSTESTPAQQNPPAQSSSPPPGGSYTSPPTTSPEAPPPLGVLASFSKQRLTDILTKGLTGTASCSVACSLDITVTVDPATAKKARLTGSKVTSARVTATANGSPARIVVRLPKAAHKKLRGMKSVPLTVKVVATGGGGRAEQTLRLNVKR